MSQYMSSSPFLYMGAFAIGNQLAEPLAEYGIPRWFSMQLPALLLCLCYGLSYWFSRSARLQAVVKPGKEAPDFQIDVSGGAKVGLQELRKEKGKPMFVAFVMNRLGGAENALCPHCPEVAAGFEELAKGKFKDKVTFLVVNIKSEEDAKAFMDRKTWKHKNACVHGWVDKDNRAEVMRLYEVKHVPYMFVLDKEGVVSEVCLGTEAVEDVLDKFFRAGAKAPVPGDAPNKKEK